MAYFLASNKYLVVASGAQINIFNSDDGALFFSQTYSEREVLKGDKNQTVIFGFDYLMFSPDNKYLCAILSNKRLLLLDVQNNMEVFKELRLKRRSTSCAFNEHNSCLYVADKSGDLYKYSLCDEDGKSNAEQEPIVAHVSMLLDVCLTSSGKYIITADRDEKIRVTDVERPFVIESFCLNHTEFVCSLLSLPNDEENIFISSSGDGSLCMWRAESGLLLCQYRITPCQQTHAEIEEVQPFIPSLLSFSNQKLAVGSISSNKVDVLEVKFKNSFSFNHLYDIDVKEMTQIKDVSFLSSSQDNCCVLCVLGVLENGSLSLRSYKCFAEFYELYDWETLIVVNPQIATMKVDENQIYQGLFKIHSGESSYSAYIKKKEERLETQAKRHMEIQNKIAAKKLKS